MICLFESSSIVYPVPGGFLAQGAAVVGIAVLLGGCGRAHGAAVVDTPACCLPPNPELVTLAPAHGALIEGTPVAA